MCLLSHFLVFHFPRTYLWRHLLPCVHLASASRRFIRSWFWLSKLGFHAVPLSLYKYYLCPLAGGFHNAERQIRRTQNDTGSLSPLPALAPEALSAALRVSPGLHAIGSSWEAEFLWRQTFLGSCCQGVQSPSSRGPSPSPCEFILASHPTISAMSASIACSRRFWCLLWELGYPYRKPCSFVHYTWLEGGLSHQQSLFAPPSDSSCFNSLYVRSMS